MAGATTLSGITDPSTLDDSPAGRVLKTIRRDMDLKGVLFRARKRNEEVISLAHQDGYETRTEVGGGDEWENVRRNGLNLPYRQTRWYESQATSKKAIVSVDRDAGAGQRPGGPGDDQIGMWLGIALGRVMYEAGFKREMKALISEVVPRGTSVMRIGYHEHAVSAAESVEAGKSAQSIIPEALSGDTEAKKGQDHAQIAQELGEAIESEEVHLSVGSQGIERLQARRDSHAKMALEVEENEDSTESVRPIRRKVWMKRRRVGEDVGWAPWVNDTADTPFWWERHVDTVAWVKAQDTLFTTEFRSKVEGNDSRSVSSVFYQGRTPSVDDMGADARMAQSDIGQEPGDRPVEWFEVWYRRPDMRSGGVRKIVCPEETEQFVELTEQNPHVDPETGIGAIPGFYPYYDFTPVLAPLAIPERTCGIPPQSVGMPHFEKLAEYSKLRQEGALKSATSVTQFHPALKDNKAVLDAVKNGDMHFGFISPQSLQGADGKMLDAVKHYGFPGVSPEIERQTEIEKLDYLNMVGMPPAIYQGMGTAKTASQDAQGIAAGEAESGVFVNYMEDRMADVMAGVRGLCRINYDDDEWTRLLGAEGAQFLKVWQTGTVDDGDEITVVFGARAQAEATVAKKQLMEAIQLVMSQVDPVTGIPLYDVAPLIEELHRRFDLGKPKTNDTVLAQLQKIARQLMAENNALKGLDAEGKPLPDQGQGGPAPSEGDGPTAGNLNAGAVRGTVPQNGAPQGAPQQTVGV